MTALYSIIHKMKKLLAICFLTIVVQSLSAQELRFDLSRQKQGKGWISVTPNSVYSKETGFGYDFGTAGNSGQPAYFSAFIPEGDYDIVLKFGSPAFASNTTIKVESRRLLVADVVTRPGQFITKTFTVHVKSPLFSNGKKVSLKPREVSKLDWDDKFTIEINGSKPALAAVGIRRNASAVTVFLAGNSTVVDQDDEPWASWGQMIPAFFRQGVSISNHAESGLSLGSFIGSHRLEKVMSEIRAGDFLFVEFGHNDQKEKGPEDGAYKSYTNRLKQFIAEARAKGATPVLVTPTSRRSFDSTGTIFNSLGDYPAAMKKVAQEEKVAIIDLNAMTAQMFQAMGNEPSKKAFVHYAAGTFPGQQVALKDDTHFNSYGAYQIAKCIVNGIRSNHLALEKYLLPTPVFDPTKFDSFADWKLALSPKNSVIKPDGN
jgi:lysophospholipase L1-like esterase